MAEDQEQPKPFLAATAWALAVSRAFNEHDEARLPPCPEGPYGVSSQAETARRRVAPLAFPGEPTEALERLRRVLLSLPGLTLIEERGNYVHALAERLLGFKDDLEFLLDPAAKVIHVRSCAKLAFYDFGANRDRVERIRRLCALPEA